MDFYIQHNDGEDFGKLTIQLGRDDFASLIASGSAGESYVELALYNHEAARLAESLAPIASAASL